MRRDRVACLLSFATLWLLTVAGVTTAQEDVTSLKNISFAHELIVSVPNDWLVWQRDDYTQTSEAVEAAVDLMQSVYTELDRERLAVPDWQTVIALPPARPDDGLIRMTVDVMQIDDYAARSGDRPDAITPRLLVERASAQPVATGPVNGQPAAFGFRSDGQQLLLIGAYRLEPDNLLSIVSISGPADWLTANEDLASLLLVSLRHEGDPIDDAAFEALTRRPLPETFVFGEITETSTPTGPTAEEGLPTVEAISLPDCPNGAPELAFVSDRDGNLEIYVMNADGENVRRLTEDPATDTLNGWSPDGTRIYFHSDQNGAPELYVVDADGSDLRQLTDNQVPDTGAAVSPDGSTVAFSRGDAPGREASIYLMNTDGANVQQLTAMPGPELWPAWSPDGEQIAFIGFADGTPDLYSITVTSGEVRRLTTTEVQEGPPVWSPDGAQILFWADFEQPRVYVMNAHGGELRAITSEEGASHAVSWSIDNLIPLQSNRDGDFELYLMQADGTVVRRLTNNAANDIDARWRPCSTPVDTRSFEEIDIAVAACDVTAPRDVNLRAGPGTMFDAVDVLAEGTSAAVTGQATGADGMQWWRLDDALWVHAGVVNARGGCDSVPEVAP